MKNVYEMEFLGVNPLLDISMRVYLGFGVLIDRDLKIFECIPVGDGKVFKDIVKSELSQSPRILGRISPNREHVVDVTYQARGEEGGIEWRNLTVTLVDLGAA